MITASNHNQGWMLAGSAKPATRHGVPASVAGRDNQKFPVTSSRRAGRLTSLDRPNSRSVTQAPGFFFTPRALTLDDLDHIRICELSGRHATLARGAVGQSFADQSKASTAVRAQVHVLRSSQASVFDDRHRDREALEPCSPNRGIRYPQ